MNCLKKKFLSNDEKNKKLKEKLEKKLKITLNQWQEWIQWKKNEIVNEIKRIKKIKKQKIFVINYLIEITEEELEDYNKSRKNMMYKICKKDIEKFIIKNKINNIDIIECKNNVLNILESKNKDIFNDMIKDIFVFSFFKKILNKGFKKWVKYDERIKIIKIIKKSSIEIDIKKNGLKEYKNFKKYEDKIFDLMEEKKEFMIHNNIRDECINIVRSKINGNKLKNNLINRENENVNDIYTKMINEIFNKTF
jgi:hypothetical protein